MLWNGSQQEEYSICHQCGGIAFCIKLLPGEWESWEGWAGGLLLAADLERGYHATGISYLEIYNQEGSEAEAIFQVESDQGLHELLRMQEEASFCDFGRGILLGSVQEDMRFLSQRWEAGLQKSRFCGGGLHRAGDEHHEHFSGNKGRIYEDDDS